jgi:hypothetical protein
MTDGVEGCAADIIVSRDVFQAVLLDFFNLFNIV